MTKKYSPNTLYQPHGQYHQAVEVGPNESLIYSSGLIGCRADGSVIEDPTQQINQAWKNVAAFLEGCALTVDNLVRLKMHLADADLIPVSREARIRALGEPMCAAVTGVIVQLFDPALVIEIDVIASRPA